MKYFIFFLLFASARCRFAGLCLFTGLLLTHPLPFKKKQTISSFTIIRSAQAQTFPAGARMAALNQADPLSIDIWAGLINPAGLAFLSHRGTGLFYGNRFLLPEMNLGAVVVAYPLDKSAMSGGLTFDGFSLFYEAMPWLAYGRKFSTTLAGGLSMAYRYVQIGEGYGRYGFMEASLGLAWEALPDLYMGFRLSNPWARPGRTALSPAQPSAVYSLQSGLKWLVSEHLMMCLGAFMQADHPPSLLLGMEYCGLDIWCLRLGMGTRPLSQSFGFGIKTNSLIIDLAAQRHLQLGYSPRLGVSLLF